MLSGVDARGLTCIKPRPVSPWLYPRAFMVRVEAEGMMVRRSGIEYLVEQHGKDWTVSFGGRHFGRFPNRLAALRSAISDARRVRHHGYEITVRVQRKTGEFRRVPNRLIDVFDAPIGLGPRFATV